jgi:DNA repair exonuclease SbcCD ATPase subunit
MDFGKRQEQAATVNNAYQYHLDQKREQDLKEEKERYKSISVIVFLGAALLISVGYILNVKRKQRHLKELAALSSELQRVSDDDKKLREDIKRKEKDLAESKASLKRSSSELDDVRKKLQRVNQELLENNDVLKKTEEQLEEKKEQNKTFIKLLHQSEFEEKAEDIVRAVRAASKGKKEMTLAEWKQLYKAVDELYPTFHETILKQHRRVSDKEMQVLYLIRIGLSKQQIINLTDIARVTIWRWEKKFEWVLTSES